MEKAKAERFLSLIFNNEGKIRGVMCESVNNDFAEAVSGDITTDKFDDAVGRLLAIVGKMYHEEFKEWEFINKVLPALVGIAKREMDVETFEVFNSDEKDFHSVATWSIESALVAAFNLGRKTR